jgi:ribosomal protein S18 acetylase RimI-like enzyme
LLYFQHSSLLESFGGLERALKQDSSQEKKEEEVSIRSLQRRDRSRIEEMVLSSGKFNDMEVATALELVDEALKKGEETSGYTFAVLEDRKGERTVVKGYACYGPTPLTQGVYDLYWIVVDPEAQGKGFGRLLMEHVERQVVKRGGRMILIETSSQETYGATIRFYNRAGYELVARIKGFYRIGDDKLIFSKELSRVQAVHS